MSREIQLLYHRPGKGTTRFTHRLILDDPGVKILLMDAYPGAALLHDGEVMLAEGAAGIWFVFPKAWYDIGTFHDADDRLTGWYTNLCRPVKVRDPHWEFTDLFLDLWQPADGGPPQWLDEAEYGVARSTGVIDPETATTISTTRREIDQRVNAGAWPPAAVRSFSLTEARRLADAQE